MPLPPHSNPSCLVFFVCNTKTTFAKAVGLRFHALAPSAVYPPVVSGHNSASPLHPGTHTTNTLMLTAGTLRTFVRLYTAPPLLAALVLGFSSGLPLVLVFSTLTFWLVDAGIDKSTIGLFALVKTPYTFKFLFAPLMDALRLPGLARWLGHRRSWAFVAQLGLIAALLALSLTRPAEVALWTAALAVAVACGSAIQDVALDAWRVERFPDPAQQARATSVFVTGYRIAMLVAGAGALWLATHVSWPTVYVVMAVLQGIGVAAVLLASEAPQKHTGTTGATCVLPEISPKTGRFVTWTQAILVAPLRTFMQHTGWQAILLVALTYKLGDAFLGVMINPFYVETGFSKLEIAEITKLYGFIATIAGAFIGGWLVTRLGLFRALVWGALLQLLSNLSFLWLSHAGHSVPVLAAVVTLENLSGGIGTTAYLSLFAVACDRRYTATQFALLTSLMALARDLLAAQSGFVADAVSWSLFFCISALLAVPGLVLLLSLRSTLHSVMTFHDADTLPPARPIPDTA
jgi:MFS transporter, PAT family, beta-lactamase induction signal transducer AmpG